MPTNVRSWLVNLLMLFQVPRICRYFNRDKITIVAYHGFTKNTSFGGVLNSQRMHIDVNEFREHLRYLRTYYNIVPLSQIVDHYAKGKELPKYTLAVTIDDGYRSTYELAYPMLKEFDIVATVFVSTNFVANNEPTWYDRVEYAISHIKEPSLEITAGDFALTLSLMSQIERLDSLSTLRNVMKSVRTELMADILVQLERKSSRKLVLDGNHPILYSPLQWPDVAEMLGDQQIAVGSHTKNHVILTKCTPEEVYEELLESKQVIEREIGQTCDMFCYPNGQLDDFSAETEVQLRTVGYRCGLTSVPGMNDQNTNVLQLKRFSTVGTLDEFALTICGAKLYLSRLKELFLGKLGDTQQVGT